MTTNEDNRATLASEAYNAIYAYLLSYSPGDEATTANVDSETEKLMEAVTEATYRVDA